MTVSVTDPFNGAFEQTRRVLFSPFSIGKWFVIGFAAWLTSLTSGNVGGNIPNIPGVARGGFPGGTPSEVIDWVDQNLTMVIAVAAGISVFAFVLIGVVTWLRSRATFIFVDNIVFNNAQIIKPWSRFAVLGNSLFLMRMLVVTIGYVLLLATLLIALLIAWSDLANDRWEGAATASAVFVGAMALFAGVSVKLLTFFIDNVVMPVMYARSLPASQAWPIATRLLRDHFWQFVLFMLMKLAIAIAVGMLATLLTFLTCCIPAIPYLGTVILLPLFVFPMLYTLKFISQCGRDLDMFEKLKHLCENCRYSLIGLEGAAVCPECGTPLPADPQHPPVHAHNCDHCGHDLTRLHGAAVCPECGAPIMPTA